MKVITYVKRGIDKPFIKIEHAVRKNYSANEEFEYWCNICERAKKGSITMLQPENMRKIIKLNASSYEGQQIMKAITYGMYIKHGRLIKRISTIGVIAISIRQKTA